MRLRSHRDGTSVSRSLNEKRQKSYMKKVGEARDQTHDPFNIYNAHSFTTTLWRHLPAEKEHSMCAPMLAKDSKRH